MKLLGCLMLTVSGLCWGMERAHRLRIRAELLVELLRFMQFLRTEIHFSAYSLGQLLAMGEDSFSQKAAGLYALSQDPAAALTEAGNMLLTCRKDRELFQRFAHGLGASDTQGQLEHLELHMSLVRERIQEARDEYMQKNRLYIVLGLFVGVAVCVIIL